MKRKLLVVIVNLQLLHHDIRLKVMMKVKFVGLGSLGWMLLVRELRTWWLPWFDQMICWFLIGGGSMKSKVAMEFTLRCSYLKYCCNGWRSSSETSSGIVARSSSPKMTSAFLLPSQKSRILSLLLSFFTHLSSIYCRKKVNRSHFHPLSCFTRFNFFSQFNHVLFSILLQGRSFVLIWMGWDRLKARYITSFDFC